MGRPIIDVTGQRFERLVVLERHPELHSSKQAQWICLCDCGNGTVVTGHNLRSGGTRSCGCLVKDHLKMARAKAHEAARLEPHELTYAAAHVRLRASRGPAREHACVDCGSRAQEWSLRHEAPVTFLVPVGRFRCRISADLDDYEPRCSSCHRLYDREGMTSGRG